MSALAGLGLGAIVESVGRVVTDLVTTDKERMAFELENRRLDQALDLGQIEVNKIEAAHASWFVAGWRPAAGWACVGGLVYQVMARPLLGWIMQNAFGWSEPPALEMDTLLTLLFGMLGLGGYRTLERVRGKA